MVKLKKWTQKQDQWLPKESFLTILPSLLPHTAPHTARDVDRVYGLAAYYSNSLQGVDWDGFANAATTLQWFEDDYCAMPMFYELYQTTRDEQARFGTWLGRIVVALQGGSEDDADGVLVAKASTEHAMVQSHLVCNLKWWLFRNVSECGLHAPLVGNGFSWTLSQLSGVLRCD